MVILKATRWLTPSCLSALAGVGAALLFCNPAAAEACDDQGGCPHGFVCHEREDQACPEIACAPDSPECAKDSLCETHKVSECLPATCTSNDDCASDMVCFEERYDECDKPTAQACREGEECAPPPVDGPKCETKTRSSCTPRYVPPCKEDADCGPGFSCTEIIEQSCSGSAGRDPGPGVGTAGSGGSSASSDAGVGDGGASDGAGDSAGEPSDMDAKAFAPSEPSCTTRPTGQFRCELQRIDCEAASDCPSGFTCEAIYSGATCNSAGVAPGAPAAPAPQDAGVASDPGSGGSSGSSGGDDGEHDKDNPDDKVPPADQPPPADDDSRPPPPDMTCAQEPAPSEKVCLPPYAREQLGRGGLHGDGSALPEFEQAPTSSGGAKDTSDDAAENPSDPDAAATPIVCSVSTPGAGAGGLLGFLGTLGTAAIVIARRGSRRR